MATKNNVLDMDFLHKITDNPDDFSSISAPSLSKSSFACVAQKGTLKENFNEITTKESNDIPQLKVCHICRKRDEGEFSFKTCCNPNCKEAFCSECIEKICRENQMESEVAESGNNNK